MIISICNTKGGVGKSTIAVHIAHALSREQRTLLIDTDAQQSAAQWAAWRAETQSESNLTTIALHGVSVAREGAAMARDYGAVVIDAGGGNHPGLRASLAIAQLCIVPIGASEFDTAAMNDFIDVLTLAMPLNPGLQVRALLNRISRTRETREVEKFLNEAGLKMFDAKIHERVSYRRAVAAGSTVEDHDDDKARREIRSLMREIHTIQTGVKST